MANGARFSSPDPRAASQTTAERQRRATSDERRATSGSLSTPACVPTADDHGHWVLRRAAACIFTTLRIFHDCYPHPHLHFYVSCAPPARLLLLGRGGLYFLMRRALRENPFVHARGCGPSTKLHSAHVPTTYSGASFVFSYLSPTSPKIVVDVISSSQIPCRPYAHHQHRLHPRSSPVSRASSLPLSDVYLPLAAVSVQKTQ